MSVADDARRFLRAHHIGVVATHSKSAPGYPFGSVVPFACDAEGRPIVLISGLAEHTRSLEQDARASLVVHDMTVVDTAGPRLTIVGDAARCDDDAAAARYLRAFPDAERLLTLADFAFWRLIPREALFVRGFGRIEWVKADALAPPPNEISEFEADALAHMNADHADAVAAYCAARGIADTTGAQMVGIDVDGFDVRAGSALVRVPFDVPVTTGADLRRTLVDLARRARGA
jgi:putative heme iron utilization protein